MDEQRDVTVITGEFLARRSDRRTFLGRMAQAAYAAAIQASCECSPPYGVYCSNCPGAGGCPSGCSFCTQGQDSSCPWPSGYWTTNCGSCFYYCSDCRCGDQICGCKSTCISTLAA